MTRQRHESGEKTLLEDIFLFPWDGPQYRVLRAGTAWDGKDHLLRSFETREEAILHLESLGLPFLDLPFEPWSPEIWRSGRIVPVPLGEDRK